MACSVGYNAVPVKSSCYTGLFRDIARLLCHKHSRRVKKPKHLFPTAFTTLPSCAPRLDFLSLCPIRTDKERNHSGEVHRHVDWQVLLAYITGSVEQAPLLSNEYLVTENRILCQQIQGRVRLSHREERTPLLEELHGSKEYATLCYGCSSSSISCQCPESAEMRCWKNPVTSGGT